MPVPTQAQSRIIQIQKQIILVAGILSIAAACRLFGISRPTFYKYRRREAAGDLGIISSSPHRHGRAKDQAIIDAVLNARSQHPTYGKKRISDNLSSIGIKISPNAVQRILKDNNLQLKFVKTKRNRWRYYEAIAPNMIWYIDVCYLYTKKQHGFNLYLISILDDHSRKIVASGLFPYQTVAEVTTVLKQAVQTYGVPKVLICDNGSQFTCSDFRRICKQIELPIDYAPKYYPQYKGKLERFFRTVRAEMERSDSPQLSVIFHNIWIDYYNTHRIHSRVTDAHGQVHVPEFRFNWKQSAARSLKSDLPVDEIFTVRRPREGACTREVKANLSIKYLNKTYKFNELNKGDIVEIKENSEQIKFFFNDKQIHCISKPPIPKRGCTRKVNRHGVVKFKHALIFLGLPKNTHILIVYEGGYYVFYENNRVAIRIKEEDFKKV